MAVKITQALLKNCPCYKAGKKITIKGIMLHSVGCPQPNANTFVRIFGASDYTAACVHAFIDGNTGEVFQTLPWAHRGWHAGGDANNTHIGVEMCEPACIKYTSGANFTCSDKAKAREVVQRTYESAVELFAHLCKYYKLDPLADGVIISHAEGSKRKVASAHADPEHLWKGLGLGYTMDTFRKAVKSAMTEETPKGENTQASTNKTLYRVQVGAYADKKNAEAQLAKLKKAGFDGYITT